MTLEAAAGKNPVNHVGKLYNLAAGRMAEALVELLPEVQDASCVLVNASTRFNDGGELGLGAEIGISTTKLHAYGPMGLESLTAEKWVVIGGGQIRG